MAKTKILIVSYYWTPAGGPGVQRWLKFVKYLPDFGIEPHVYVPENPTYPLIDERLGEEVEGKAVVVKQKIREPYGLASLFSKKQTKKISSGIITNTKKQTFLEKAMLWIRGNLFIPDARMLWVKPSVAFLKKYITENQIETIITTGPPHSLHLIGLQLKKELNIKWITDFRDPWTTIGYHKELKLTAWAEKKHKKQECEVLQNCEQIIVTSPTTKKEFEALTNTPISLITNGYDIENVSKKPMDEKFTLAHIGSLLSERNPFVLWESLKELTVENPDFAKKLEIKLIGAVSNEILETLKRKGLENYVKNKGYVPHNEALQEQHSSQVLLLIEIDSENTKSIVPGKLFEYMIAERPIVGLGHQEADFASILKETNTGKFFTYREKEALKTHIQTLFKQYQRNTLKSYPVGLQQYSRKMLTKKLVELL